LQRCGQINTLGAFREAGNRVYWLAPDSTNEHILYDFNLTVGQTISNVIYVDGFAFYEFPFIYLSGTLTVSAVSTVVVNGTNRKKIEFAGSTAAWIEGVGNTNGFLLNNEAIINDYELELKCMTVGGNAVYPIAGTGTCQFNVGIEDENINSTVIISPNPSTGDFYVNMEGVTGSMDVQITDLNGKTVAHIENHDGQKSISTNLKSGAYIIRATVNGKVTTSKLIIE